MVNIGGKVRYREDRTPLPMIALPVFRYKSHISIDRHLRFTRMSVLNRHYVVHGFGPGNIYRSQDVHRMNLAFDLLIDWQSHVQGNHGSIFVEDDDPMVSKRMTITMPFRRATRH